jgi:hypothetical protein
MTTGMLGSIVLMHDHATHPRHVDVEEHEIGASEVPGEYLRDARILIGDEDALAVQPA